MAQPVRTYVPPPMPTYVDPNAPVLPPPSFSSPEGPYTLVNNFILQSTIMPPPPPPVSQMPANSFSGMGMSPAMAMAGMGMGGIPPGMFGMSGGGGASASPVAQGGPVAGPAYGQNNPANGVPNPWPVKAAFVSFTFNGRGGAGDNTSNTSGWSGGLLGKKKTELQATPDRRIKAEDAASSDDEEDNSHEQNKLEYEQQYSQRGPGGRSRMPPRPKNNLRSTNSSFLTRVSVNESYTRLVQNPPHLDPTAFASSHFSQTPARGNNPPPTHWTFINVGRTLVWLLVDPTGKFKDPIMRFWFSANVTAFGVSEVTKVAPGQQGERLDLMVGFATGDLVWIDPLFGKYTRLSKGGIVHPVPVTHIRWHPRIPTLCYILYNDGNIFAFSTEREDPPYLVSTAPSPWSEGMRTAVFKAEEQGQARAVEPAPTNGASQFLQPRSGNTAPPAPPTSFAVEVEKEVQKAKKAEMMFNWKNEEQVVDKKVAMAQGGLSHWAGRNPVSVVKLGTLGIKDLEFSPDGQILAAVSDDGTLKIFDITTTKLTDVYSGYFGALTCLAWSPDGRYLLIGGQDDLITIFSPTEGRIVARCQGHASFVTQIAFDRRRSSSRGYRFGSVGEDGRILLWDFTAASLQRPRHAHGAHHRGSIGSIADINSSGTGGQVTSPDGVNYHPAPLRSDVAMLQPITNKLIEPCMINCLSFLQEAVVTVSRAGGLKFWTRPPASRRLGADKKATSGAKAGTGLAGGMRNLKLANTVQNGRTERVGA